MGWFRPTACIAVLLALAPVGAGAEGTHFDPHLAWAHLERQCALGPRVAGLPGHEQGAAYLETALRQHARQVCRQEFTARVQGKQVRFTNLLADFPAGAAAEHLLLCAHWDTRPQADQEQDRQRRATPITGANDGASGVAVLLEVARLLAARPCRYHVTIALFDGEDFAPQAAEMFAGAREYARRPWPARPAWGVLLDMVGDRDLALPREQHAAARAGEATTRVWQAARQAGAAAFQDRLGPLVMDDHWPLIEAGIPTTLVIDFDYPHWHRLTDTPANCAPASLGQVGRMLEALLWP